MRVLVTGGAGYIGTHTVLDLAAQGHSLCIVDNFHNSSQEAVERTRSLSNRHFEFHQADIRDEGALSDIFDAFRPEAVVHFAGLKAVGEGQQKPVEYFDVNVTGTVQLLKAMDRVGCKTIVFSSSATVYGEAQYLPIDENHPVNPGNVYGQTKATAETLIQTWQAATQDSCAVLLRYFNPVGAHPSGALGEDPSDIPNNLMPFITQVAVGRRPHLSVFGDDYPTRDGTGVRDYIHVSDLARAHTAALTFATGRSETAIFNLGTGAGISVLEMVAAFAKASGKEIPYQVTARRPGDIAEIYADPQRANALLNWAAEKSLDDMCQSSWLWQSQNPNGYA